MYTNDVRTYVGRVLIGCRTRPLWKFTSITFRFLLEFCSVRCRIFRLTYYADVWKDGAILLPHTCRAHVCACLLHTPDLSLLWSTITKCVIIIYMLSSTQSKVDPFWRHNKMVLAPLNESKSPNDIRCCCYYCRSRSPITAIAWWGFVWLDIHLRYFACTTHKRPPGNVQPIDVRSSLVSQSALNDWGNKNMLVTRTPDVGWEKK